MFKRNEGILDRIVRVALGLVLLPAGLIWYGLQGNIVGLVIAGFGVLGLLTGFTGVCPLYIPFGFSTLGKEKELFARCMSMMNSFRQGSGGSGSPSMGQMCGPCASATWKTQDQPDIADQTQ